MAGHLQTILPSARHLIWKEAEPSGSKDWSGRVRDPKVGEIPLRGRYHDLKGARGLVVIVHGLGGSENSFYALRAARAAAAAGFSSLRLSLRGAAGDALDFYHAGLTADLEAACQAGEFARYEDLFVLGYSMGGNQSLVMAARRPPERLRALAVACPPVDLGACGRALDEAGPRFYRRWILRALNKHYREVEKNRGVATPSLHLKGIDTFRAWDSLTIVPRFGFDDVDQYYARASAARCLDMIEAPTLVVAAEDDPIIASAPLRQAASARSSAVDWRWLKKGGHLGFKKKVDLGFGAPSTFESQVMTFFRRRGDELG